MSKLLAATQSKPTLLSRLRGAPASRRLADTPAGVPDGVVGLAVEGGDVPLSVSDREGSQAAIRAKSEKRKKKKDNEWRTGDTSGRGTDDTAVCIVPT